MRLINFLNEGTEDPEKILNKIKEKCGYFLSLIKDNKDAELYRGIRNVKLTYELQKFKVQKRRKPLDTNEDISKILDSGFNSVFGIKARTQTMFCIGNKEDAVHYRLSILRISYRKI